MNFKSFLIFGVVSLFVGGIFYTPALALEQTAGELSGELAQLDSPTPTTSVGTTTPEALTTEPASLITTAPIEATDLGVPEPSGWQFFKRKFKRIFSFSQISRLRLDIEIAKLTLLKARQAQNLGNTTLADKLLADYQTKVAALTNRITTITESLKGKDPQADALLAQVQQDLVLEASLIDQLGAVKTTQLQKKLFKVKLDTLKHLTRLLAKENLPPEKLAQKINQLSGKLIQKEAKIEKKIAKRLALLDNLGEADEKNILEEGLEGAENQVVREVAQVQNQTSLGQIVREIEGSTRKHIIVLQKVLEQVPEQAKPAIQAVIDKELEKIAERQQKAKEEGPQAKTEETTQAVKSQSVTIEVKEGRISPTKIEVAKDTKLTIRFSNRDKAPRALTFSNGASTGALPAGGETETVLTVIGPLTFEVSGIGKGQIVLK